MRKNPAPDATARTPGGFTGTVQLSAGDQITWECEVDNTLATPITFGQQVLTSEMCILFGLYAPSDGRTWTAAQ